jgi:hypothetical protein
MGGRSDDPFRNIAKRPEDAEWFVPPQTEDIL